jgi:hypothetical protein
MNIKQFIEFLQTLPQDATVCVLSHYSEHSVYIQGGSCKVKEFSTEGKENMRGEGWVYGEHYELTTDSSGQMYLQLGVMDK